MQNKATALALDMAHQAQTQPQVEFHEADRVLGFITTDLDIFSREELLRIAKDIVQACGSPLSLDDLDPDELRTLIRDGAGELYDRKSAALESIRRTVDQILTEISTS